MPNTIEFADWIGRTKQKKIRVTGYELCKSYLVMFEVFWNFERLFFLNEFNVVSLDLCLLLN